ncbi:MAG: hypothetical protein AMXMBFR82_24590 [Candidatus Hydrogenedentota bacterium]
MNIRFEYLYRDAENYKIWGDVVFLNPQGLSVDYLNKSVGQMLTIPPYFVAQFAKVPDLRRFPLDSNRDHSWHEVFAFLDTQEPDDDPLGREIDRFIGFLQTASCM